jgi:hypothetical protein
MFDKFGWGKVAAINLALVIYGVVLVGECAQARQQALRDVL